MTEETRIGNLAIEEKYDEVKTLITLGKEKGYLLFDEVNDILPSEVSSSEELDELSCEKSEERKMSIKSDKWIKMMSEKHHMITPYQKNLIRTGIISFAV